MGQTPWIPVERTPDMDAQLAKMNAVQNANEDCAVCTEPNPVTRAAILPCQHSFCVGCIQEWTRSGHKTCPICRAPFDPLTVLCFGPNCARNVNEFFKRAIVKQCMDAHYEPVGDKVGNGRIQSVAVDGSTQLLTLADDIDWTRVTKFKPGGSEN